MKKTRKSKAEPVSSLSLLDENVTKQLVSVAEIAIKNHMLSQKSQKDEDVQVLSETCAKPNQTVLQLGLPKDLQLQIIEQLRASGQSAGQIDLHSLFSEVFNKTMKRMNGLEITNCSLRISSNGKKRQSLTNDEVPTKKRAKINNSNATNNNKTSQINDNGHKSSQQGSEEPLIKRPVGRPRKSCPILNNQPPKKLAKVTLKPKRRCSKRLHDHAMKEWPYFQKEGRTSPNNSKKKKKLKGPHRENAKVRLLRKIPLSFKNGQTLFGLTIFNQLFVDFKISPNSLMSMLVSLYGADSSKDFVFKKWQVTHLSLRAAQDVVNVMNKPLMMTKVLSQLQTLPIVPLEKVSPENYNKTHLTQLSRNEFCNLFALGPLNPPTRVSQRTKQPTQKFQDSPCINSMTTLSTSITTPPKKAPKLHSRIGENQSKMKFFKDMDKSWINGKLRPKYRQLLDLKKSGSKKKINNLPENDFNFLADVAADEDEILLLEDDSPEVVDVTEMNDRLCQVINEIQEDPILPYKNGNLAVRKFPSYGWNREREARIKIEMSSKKQDNLPIIQVKKSRNLDFPPFQLSGLVETAPKEVEGWFTSKVSLLRQLSESGTVSKSVSPSSSRSGSVQKKLNLKSTNGKVPVVKVFLDHEIENVVDLPEYKHHLEQINSIIEEIEATNQQQEEENDEIETLRVAKKIEKISIAGIGKQVSLPSPQTFLPPGWHSRKSAEEGWEYVNHDGYKVKSIQAAIKYEASKKSASISTELLNSTIP